MKSLGTALTLGLLLASSTVGQTNITENTFRLDEGAAPAPATLLCHVKGACERVAAQNRVELTSDVAFQAPEDFSFCPALFSPSSGVRLGPLIDP